MSMHYERIDIQYQYKPIVCWHCNSKNGVYFFIIIIIFPQNSVQVTNIRQFYNVHVYNYPNNLVYQGITYYHDFVNW